MLQSWLTMTRPCRSNSTPKVPAKELALTPAAQSVVQIDGSHLGEQDLQIFLFAHDVADGGRNLRGRKR